MSEITLAGIAKVIREELKPVNEKLHSMDTRLTAVEKTLNQHTTMLDSLTKDVKILLDEKTVSAHRVERLEQWAQQVGPKVGVKLEL